MNVERRRRKHPTHNATPLPGCLLPGAPAFLFVPRAYTPACSHVFKTEHPGTQGLGAPLAHDEGGQEQGSPVTGRSWLVLPSLRYSGSGKLTSRQMSTTVVMESTTEVVDSLQWHSSLLDCFLLSRVKISRHLVAMANRQETVESGASNRMHPRNRLKSRAACNEPTRTKEIVCQRRSRLPQTCVSQAH